MNKKIQSVDISKLNSFEKTEYHYFEKSWGDLSFANMKESLLFTLRIYEQSCWNKAVAVPERAKQWINIHDTIAFTLGYWGDMDIYWSQYVEHIENVCNKTKSKTQLITYFFTCILKCREMMVIKKKNTAEFKANGGHVIDI